MVPWNMLPKDLQKAILAMAVLYGGTMACAGPMVCDPAPPPSMTPRPMPSKTPMICDPPPPPRTVTPFRTPMICDPAPPPTVAPKPTATVEGISPRHFQVRSVQTTSDPSVSGAKVQGKVVNQQGRPLSGLKVSAEGQSRVQVVTGSEGEFALYLTEPGDYRIMVEGGLDHALHLQLKQHDVVTVEWVEVKQTSQAPLPLAEIRTVEIAWEDGLTFGADTPWPEARYRWSVSGGTLVETDESVTWQPPAEPGRYLLQVVADWGPTGLAVDALTLIVEQDGNVTVG
jgi:hypothetical protein